MVDLGDILVAIVREMIGMPASKQSASRRRETRPSSRQTGTTVAIPATGQAEGRQARRRREQTAKTDSSPIAKPQSRHSKHRLDWVEGSPAVPPPQSVPEPVRPAKPQIAKPAPVIEHPAPTAHAMPSRGRGSSALVSDGFAERMRNDRQALRDALVAAEILGPPLADRFYSCAIFFG